VIYATFIVIIIIVIVVTCHIGSPSVTCHLHSTLTPTRQAANRPTCRRDEKLSWLYTEMVYLPAIETASTIRSRGKDRRVTWHLQSTQNVNPRSAHKVEAPPGRPRHTWLRTLEADLQPHNLGLNSAWRCAQDREHWKHVVETATLQLGACAWWWWWWSKPTQSGHPLIDRHMIGCGYCMNRGTTRAGRIGN